MTADVNKLLETNATLTKTLLGDASMTDEVRATLLNYARGGDPANAGCSDADSGTACSAWRAWPHGDVLHSNPAILPYEKDVDLSLIHI